MKTWEDEISEYGSLHNDDCCVHFPEDSRACDVGIGPMDCCENMRIIRTKIEEAERRGEERERERIKKMMSETRGGDWSNIIENL